MTATVSTEEIMPLHVVDGIGDPGRHDPGRHAAAQSRAAAGARKRAAAIHAYQRYDERITDAAGEWLQATGGGDRDKPWVLFVSLVCPHFPLISRPEWYELYPEDAVPWPKFYAMNERPKHPLIDAMRRIAVYDKAFDEPKVRRRSWHISAW